MQRIILKKIGKVCEIFPFSFFFKAEMEELPILSEYRLNQHLIS